MIEDKIETLMYQDKEDKTFRKRLRKKGNKIFIYLLLFPYSIPLAILYYFFY